MGCDGIPWGLFRVVAGPDLLGPDLVYKCAARDVPPALWKPRVHGSHVRGNVIPSTGL